MIIEASVLRKGELPRNAIIRGNVLNVLKKLPDNSADCIITSPPYYGMRIYSGAETVWGGDSHCEHEWREYVTIRNSNLPVKPISKICSKCGAWFGQLGLEPSAEMYLDHLLQVTAELKRVLKPTELMFWVHNDTYSGSWSRAERKSSPI